METWKTIPEFPDYAVSNMGGVKRLTPARRTYVGKILKPMLCARYLYAGLIRSAGVLKRVRIHRLVAQAFIPNPLNLPEVNHKNPHDRLNNAVDNLEWTTQQGNSDHAVAHGLLNKPHKNAKHVYLNAWGNWKVKIQGKYLGTFKTKSEAIKVAQDYLTN